MSNYIYASTINRTSDGKLYAQAVRISTSKNLASLIRDLPHIEALNIMPSKAKAIETAKAWEDSFIANGSSAFTMNFVCECWEL